MLGYSEPIHTKLTLDELQNYLYSLPNLPTAIPYVTSYYEKRWGFCITQNQRDSLKDGIYEIFIDSKFKENGELNYGEMEILSTTSSKDWILISTYLCHPQMANNELSGPVVMAKLINWLKTQKTRNYNYKFIIIPETIGSICYISKNLDFLKHSVKAGFVLSCLGDDMNYSMILSPGENSLSDRIALHTIKFLTNEPKIYPFLSRGSDERQFNSPLLNLGVVTLCKTKFGMYKEYHTSLDDLSLVSEQGLRGGFNFVKNAISNLELNKVYQITTYCEPNLGSRGLISTLSAGSRSVENIRHFLAYCDGKREAIEIANIMNLELKELKEVIESCLKFGLIKEIK